MTDHSDIEPAEVVEPRREPVFNLPAIVIVLIGACVAIHVVRATLLSEDTDLSLLLHFAFWPIRYSGGYELDIYAFVSPVSYSLLHGGVAHLVVNMIWLAAFGSPLAARIGAVRFVLFWVATTLGAVALHYVLHSESIVPLVGASGAISGMMGAAARFAFRIDRASGRGAFAGAPLSIPAVFTNRQTLTFLAVWMVVNFVAGFGLGTPGMDSQIAWEAHVGGFVVGFFGLRLFDRRSAD
ncbi:MAG: rhomboid family intramembrane serine protease [Rhizobiaceae bacterium]|nr:rhomboid family intramembrane serine protease [Rhizobiaceae bacterium]